MARLMLFGIDVSEHQGAIDWPKVAAAGITFAILKAKEGTSYTDPRYAANLHGARTAGIPVVGAYHFLVNTSSPVTQADAFCALAPPDGLHALDVEAPGPLDPRAWVTRYREHYPHHPLLIYTGKYLWSQRARIPYSGSGFGPLWVAGAVPGAYVPGVDESPAKAYARVGSQDGGVPFWGWTDWTLMQFSEACRVPGIPTRVDANAYRGTLEQLHALTGQETDMPLTDDDVTRVAKASAAALANLGLGGEGITWAVALQRLYNRPSAAVPADIAAALTPTLTAALTPPLATAIKALPAGGATVDDATIARIAKAAVDELNTRLVR